jgi:heme/copper-type cytochrome/quinol oxidase subunit 3
MATTVHEPPKVKPPRSPEPRYSGNGGFRNLVPNDGKLPAVQDYAPPPSETAIWVLLAAIGMSFAAFTSALIVRQGASLDWRHLTLPPILYLNTLVLLGSSVTLELARRRVAVFMGGARTVDQNPSRWLYVNSVLGLVFVAGQYAAWLQLRSRG